MRTNRINTYHDHSSWEVNRRENKCKCCCVFCLLSEQSNSKRQQQLYKQVKTLHKYTQKQEKTVFFLFVFFLCTSVRLIYGHHLGACQCTMYRKKNCRNAERANGICTITFLNFGRQKKLKNIFKCTHFAFPLCLWSTLILHELLCIN